MLDKIKEKIDPETFSMRKHEILDIKEEDEE